MNPSFCKNVVTCKAENESKRLPSGTSYFAFLVAVKRYRPKENKIAHKTKSIKQNEPLLGTENETAHVTVNIHLNITKRFLWDGIISPYALSRTDMVFSHRK